MGNVDHCRISRENNASTWLVCIDVDLHIACTKWCFDYFDVPIYEICTLQL
jgi:hypothetical protein